MDFPKSAFQKVKDFFYISARNTNILVSATVVVLVVGLVGVLTLTITLSRHSNDTIHQPQGITVAGYASTLNTADSSLQPSIDAHPMSVEESQSQISQIYVHIAGAVENPGVYALMEGARAGEAVSLATPTAEADVNALNLAAPIMDGQKIVVPTKEEVAQRSAQSGTTISGTPGTSNGKVNINTADLSTLKILPGIGDVKAQAIIDYRAKYGPFKAVTDIRKVSGIGTALYAKIEAQICI